jgi:hypothetical protein
LFFNSLLDYSIMPRQYSIFILQYRKGVCIMFKTVLSAVFVLITAVSFSYAGSGPSIHEGQWEITSTMEMEGVPAGGAEPMKYSQCLTGKDAVPQSPDTVKGCTIKNIKTEGGTVTWAMRCEEQGATIDASGTVTYTSDTMQGAVKMILNDPEGGKIKMTQHMSGKRIGDCKK